jgi:hypothetical protein
MRLRRKRPESGRDVDSIRRDLHKAIERDTGPHGSPAARRQRRGLAVAAVASLLVLGLGSAAASALIFGTTGIPALDRIVNARHARESPRSSARSARQSAPPVGPLSQPFQPAPGETSGPLRWPAADLGDRRLEGFAYLNEPGNVCFVVAVRDRRRPTQAVPANFGACGPFARGIARQLATAPAALAVTRSAAPGFLAGYAAANVEDLTIATPNGQPLRVRLSDPWTPDAPGAVPMRIFIATAPSHAEGPKPERNPGITRNPWAYNITARLNGRNVKVQ